VEGRRESEMTTQMHDSPAAPERAGAQRTNWVLVAVVGLIAAAVGLGAGYLLFAPESGSQADADVEALLDDFYAAVNEGDVAAIQEMSMEDATIFGVPVGSSNTLDASLENLNTRGASVPIDDPIVDEAGWLYHAAQLTASGAGSDENDVILLVDMVDAGSTRFGGDGTQKDLKLTNVEYVGG
jgi:hypothetical protein